MRPVEEFQRINAGLCIWQDYDSEVKVDCTSTAVLSENGWLLIDPIPLKDAILEELLGGKKCAAILLTSGNHQRASTDFRERLGAPIMAPAAARSELVANEWFETGGLAAGLESIGLAGGAVGESAFIFRDTLIVGDALIHLDELMILPEKYCEDQQLLRASLNELLTRDFANLCFAHGLPIVGSAHDRVRSLLQSISPAA